MKKKSASDLMLYFPACLSSDICIKNKLPINIVFVNFFGLDLQIIAFFIYSVAMWAKPADDGNDFLILMNIYQLRCVVTTAWQH